MWAIIIALPVLGVLMAVTAFSDRTVAVTQTRTEAHNAAVYYVAVPAGIKAFPVDLVPLP
jgi:hypothetical protein